MPSKPVGWDSKGKTDALHTLNPLGKLRHLGEKLGSVFEASVNETHLLIWGMGEKMSERMPVMQADIPADGSFHSEDKCHFTAAASVSNNSHRHRVGKDKMKCGTGLNTNLELCFRKNNNFFGG